MDKFTVKDTQESSYILTVEMQTFVLYNEYKQTFVKEGIY